MQTDLLMIRTLAECSFGHLEPLVIRQTAGMNWYKTLDIDKRINAKECFELACGVKFESLATLFSFAERMEILYNKLQIEGFAV